MIYQMKSLVAVSLLIVSCSSILPGQTTPSITPTISARRVPGIFHRQYKALGRRVDGNEKNQTVYKGRLFYADGTSSAVRITHQVPHYIRIEGLKERGGAILYDGRDARGLASGTDEALLETFLLDMPDGILIALQKSAELRLLGLNSGPDPDKYPNYDGPRYDVYDLTTRLEYNDNIWRHKRYYFDSQTKLLHKTRYKDQSMSPFVEVETYYSMWGSIEGSAFPARISRFENGKEVFTFIAEEIESRAGIDDALFR